jgi:hypothetical protein
MCAEFLDETLVKLGKLPQNQLTVQLATLCLLIKELYQHGKVEEVVKVNQLLLALQTERRK